MFGKKTVCLLSLDFGCFLRQVGFSTLLFFYKCLEVLEEGFVARDFQPGDDLLFQLESGFGLLRVLAVDLTNPNDPVWHILAYEDLFPDADLAEEALRLSSGLIVSVPHMALTNRAFERTPTAKLFNRPVTEAESRALEEWRRDPDQIIFDRSALLMLGLR